MKPIINLGKFISNLFELIYVDKNYKPVPVDGVSGTWELKHRYIAPIILIIAFPFIIVICLIVLIIKFLTDCLGLTDSCG